MAEISILLVGSTDRSEFREARAVLDALGEVTAVADAESACSALQRGQAIPDLIVVARQMKQFLLVQLEDSIIAA